MSANAATKSKASMTKLTPPAKIAPPLIPPIISVKSGPAPKKLTSEKCNTPNPTASTFTKMTDDSRTFGNRLRLRRLVLGWSQKEMAYMLDVSPRAVYQWETGKPPILLTQEAVDARLKIAENQRKKNLKK